MTKLFITFNALFFISSINAEDMTTYDNLVKETKALKIGLPIMVLLMDKDFQD